MRKITDKATQAFLNGHTFNGNNTSVEYKACLKNGAFPKGDNFKVLSLHGNEIAWIDSKDNSLTITNCGWFTNTTKERLNGLPNVSIQQKKGTWYLNGKEWDGKPIKIS